MSCQEWTNEWLDINAHVHLTATPSNVTAILLFTSYPAFEPLAVAFLEVRYS